MTKKVLTALLLAFVIVFSAACGKTGNLPLKNVQMTLFVGDTAKVEPTDGGSGYQFKSSDGCVSVDEQGNVKAEEIGSAVITVTGNGKTGACIIIVSAEKPVPLLSIDFENVVTELQCGAEYRLQYSKNPVNADDYLAMLWESDNEAVASVDKTGLIKCVTPGTVNISLRALGTDIVKTCAVIVNARENQLKLNVTDAYGIKGSSDLVIEPELTTDYPGEHKGVFTSKDNGIATVDAEGRVTFAAVGKTEIVYSITVGGETLNRTCKVAVEDRANYTVIRTPEQLQAIGNVSGNYCLGNDIDMAEACADGGSLWHGGSGFSPLFSSSKEALRGVFDGNGYAIKNLYIKSATHFTAFIGYISVNPGAEGVVRNLALIGGSIEGYNMTSSFVSSTDGSGSVNAGVFNCYTDITLKSNGTCGGLFAYNGGMVRYCYSLSQITAATGSGAVSVHAVGGGSFGVTDTFYNGDIYNGPAIFRDGNYVDEAVKKTTAEMKSAALWSDFDSEIWNVAEGVYPTLKTPNQR